MRNTSAVGMRLLVCTSIGVLGAPGVASAAFLHTVSRGESLSSIAAADGLSVSQLAAANGLATDAQLVAGTTVAIPSQTAPAGSVVAGAISSAAGSIQSGGQDGDSDDIGTSATPTPQTVSASPGSYVVQPGDTLTAIAARTGTSVSEIAAANGIDAGGVLPAGRAIVIPQAGAAAPAPAQAPAVGTTVVGRMTWFGGPHDPNAQGIPASGLGWRSDGMAYYNSGSLRGRWLIHFPWGQTMAMTQIDIGPAPWTGNPFDIAFSALPNTPYSWRTWPNATVTGTYEGP